MPDALIWAIKDPVASHCLVALALMAIGCPILRWLGNPSYAWYAAAFTSLYFYAREAAQAERVLKPMLGQPTSFFLTIWPGNWSGGGARVSEWLAPAALAFVLALALQRWEASRRTRTASSSPGRARR